MKLTNKLGLPEPIVTAVKRQEHDRGDADISVTELLKPPRISILEKKHAEEIEEDASERIFSLLGSVVHKILENADKSDFAEQRLAIAVEGWKVSGQMDRYFDGVLQDYKLTTLWKFKNGEVPIEFAQQTNIYAEILRQNGYPVRKIQIIGILRDWSKTKAIKEPDLPQQQVVIRDVPLWSQEFTQKFISDRVSLHKRARTGELIDCTIEDRWAKPVTYAVMKKGLKKAKRVYEKESDAIKEVSDLNRAFDDFFIQRRPGENTRCENYCSVSRFCQQFQKLKGEK